MDELHYVYALTHAGAATVDLGSGVDPRYGVEILSQGRIAAATSLVGLDQFDLAKIQEGTADVAWLGRVALRHNAIVQRLAEAGPVLPLRLATLFRNKPSLLEKLSRCEAEVAAFLDSLGDRQEWAVKVYLDRPLAERTLLACGTAGDQESKAARGAPSRAVPASAPSRAVPARNTGATRPGSDGEGGKCGPDNECANDGLKVASAGAGLRYLAGRRERLGRAAQLQTAVGRKMLAVEDRLGQVGRQWRRLRPLSAELTARPESMVWNAALLVSKDQEPPLRAICDQLKSDLGPKGLLVELTGPWPVYHFCEGIGIGKEPATA